MCSGLHPMGATGRRVGAVPVRPSYRDDAMEAGKVQERCRKRRTHPNIACGDIGAGAPRCPYGSGAFAGQMGDQGAPALKGGTKGKQRTATLGARWARFAIQNPTARQRSGIGKWVASTRAIPEGTGRPC